PDGRRPGGRQGLLAGCGRQQRLRVDVGLPHLRQQGGEVLGAEHDGAHATAPSRTRPSSSSFSTIASAVNGLITYSWAPAARARTRLPWELSVVTIINVMLRQSATARTRVTKV